MASRFSVEAIFKAVDKMTGPIIRMQGRMAGFTGSASKGLASLDRGMSSVTGTLAAGAIGVAKFGGAILAATGAATVGAIHSVEQAAGALVDRADRLSFPIEALQEWQFVAEQSGMSVDTFDKALEKFNKNLGDVKMGTGSLAGALQKLGPTQMDGMVEKLKGAKGPAEALQIYTEALSKIKDPSIKASLAVAAFGKSGAGMVNVANLGADGIAKLREEMRQNGVMTAEGAGAAEEYGDAVNSLKRSMGGLVAGVLMPLFPILKGIVERFRGWIVENKAMIQSRIVAFFESARDTLTAFAKAVMDFSARYDLPGLLSTTIGYLAALAKFLADNHELIVNLVVPFVALTGAIRAMNIVMTAANALATANPWTLLAVGVYVLVVAIWTARDSIAQFGRDLVAWFKQLSPVVQILTIAIGGIAAAFGVVYGAMLLVKGATVAYAAVTGALNGILAGARVAMLLFNLAIAANPIGAIILAVTTLVGLAALLIANWEGVAKFFMDLWDKVGGIVSKIASVFSGSGRLTVAAEDPGAADSGGPAAASGRPSPQVVTPADRIARTIEETRATSSSEVTIKDQTGRAEVTKGDMGPGLKLTRSGAF